MGNWVQGFVNANPSDTWRWLGCGVVELDRDCPPAHDQMNDTPEPDAAQPLLEVGRAYVKARSIGLGSIGAGDQSKGVQEGQNMELARCIAPHGAKSCREGADAVEHIHRQTRKQGRIELCTGNRLDDGVGKHDLSSAAQVDSDSAACQCAPCNLSMVRAVQLDSKPSASKHHDSPCDVDPPTYCGQYAGKKAVQAREHDLAVPLLAPAAGSAAHTEPAGTLQACEAHAMDPAVVGSSTLGKDSGIDFIASKNGEKCDYMTSKAACSSAAESPQPPKPFESLAKVLPAFASPPAVAPTQASAGAANHCVDKRDQSNFAGKGGVSGGRGTCRPSFKRVRLAHHAHEADCGSKGLGTTAKMQRTHQQAQAGNAIIDQGPLRALRHAEAKTDARSLVEWMIECGIDPQQADINRFIEGCYQVWPQP